MPGFEVFGDEEKKAINELFDLNGGVLFAHGFESIRNGVYKVRDFERAVSQKFSSPYCQAVSSGSAALRVALAALDIGSGDEVIVPAFTYIATVEAVLEAGAVPIIVDIDDTFNISPAAILNAITPKTRAVIPVHMLGAAADMEQVVSIAKKYGLKVIEDAAQAVGAKHKGRYLGTIGDIGCLSFDAGKSIITGEGGMVMTKKEEFFLKSRAYHDHGHAYMSEVPRGKDRAISSGFNYRLTELQGAVGIEQLKKLDKIIDAQRSNKKCLKTYLENHDFPYTFRRLLDEDELADALVFTLPSRSAAARFLNHKEFKSISTKNVPDAMQWHFAKYWTHLFDKHGFYKNSYLTEWQASAEILEKSIALPIMVKMTDSEIERIGSALVKIYRDID